MKEGEWLEQFITRLAPPTAPQKIGTIIGKQSEQSDLTNKFTMAELENSIKASKNTAPGMDNIHYIMIYKLSDTGKKLLLEIFNNIWITGNMPSQWKEYIVIPILKSSKNPNEAESYRAISLASCIFND